MLWVWDSDNAYLKRISKDGRVTIVDESHRIVGKCGKSLFYLVRADGGFKLLEYNGKRKRLVDGAEEFEFIFTSDGLLYAAIKDMGASVVLYNPKTEKKKELWREEGGFLGVSIEDLGDVVRTKYGGGSLGKALSKIACDKYLIIVKDANSEEKTLLCDLNNHTCKEV